MKNFYKKACPQYSKPSSRRRGISMLEVLIILVILGIILAIVLPQFSQMKKDQLLKNVGEDIITTLNKAHSATLASLDSSEYGVHFESDKFTLFKGTIFSVDGASNEVTNINISVTISNISLTGGASDIYFNRLSGMPSASGTVTISNGTLSKIITISATGIASIN